MICNSVGGESSEESRLRLLYALFEHFPLLGGI